VPSYDVSSWNTLKHKIKIKFHTFISLLLWLKCKFVIIQWSITAQHLRTLHEMIQCCPQFRSKHNYHIVINYGGKLKLWNPDGLRWHEIRTMFYEYRLTLSKNIYEYTFISWGLLCLHSKENRLHRHISSAGVLLLSMNYLGTRQLLTLKVSTLLRIMTYRAHSFLPPSMAPAWIISPRRTKTAEYPTVNYIYHNC
jgi:hypothetical protein